MTHEKHDCSKEEWYWPSWANGWLCPKCDKLMKPALKTPQEPQSSEVDPRVAELIDAAHKVWTGWINIKSDFAARMARMRTALNVLTDASVETPSVSAPKEKVEPEAPKREECEHNWSKPMDPAGEGYMQRCLNCNKTKLADAPKSPKCCCDESGMCDLCNTPSAKHEDTPKCSHDFACFKEVGFTYEVKYRKCLMCGERINGW
jgi:hypothetical protein